jgi:hypothetical protein
MKERAYSRANSDADRRPERRTGDRPGNAGVTYFGQLSLALRAARHGPQRDGSGQPLLLKDACDSREMTNAFLQIKHEPSITRGLCF